VEAGRGTTRNRGGMSQVAPRPTLTSGEDAGGGADGIGQSIGRGLLEIRQGEGRGAIAAVLGPERRDQRGIRADRQQLTVCWQGADGCRLSRRNDHLSDAARLAAASGAGLVRVLAEQGGRTRGSTRTRRVPRKWFRALRARAASLPQDAQNAAAAAPPDSRTTAPMISATVRTCQVWRRGWTSDSPLVIALPFEADGYQRDKPATNRALGWCHLGRNFIARACWHESRGAGGLLVFAWPVGPHCIWHAMPPVRLQARQRDGSLRRRG
jgi:hypothetical protein